MINGYIPLQLTDEIPKRNHESTLPQTMVWRKRDATDLAKTARPCGYPIARRLTTVFYKAIKTIEQ